MRSAPKGSSPASRSSGGEILQGMRHGLRQRRGPLRRSTGPVGGIRRRRLQADDQRHRSTTGQPRRIRSGVAVDSLERRRLLLGRRGTAAFELYDEDGRLLGSGWGRKGTYPGDRRDSTGHGGRPGDPRRLGREQAAYCRRSPASRSSSGQPAHDPDTTAIDRRIPRSDRRTRSSCGDLNADGVETTDCHFEYGSLGITEGSDRPHSNNYASVPCQQGNNFTGSEDHVVSAESRPKKAFATTTSSRRKTPTTRSRRATSRTSSRRANRSSRIPRRRPDQHRRRPDPDRTRPERRQRQLPLRMGREGEPLDHSTPETGTVGFNTNTKSSGKLLPARRLPQAELTGLTPDTTYEYRAVITNEAGTVASPIGEFTTYPPDAGTDPCANAHVRQQTGTALLLDCRAYELVSAANAGGYDVESDLSRREGSSSSPRRGRGPPSLLAALRVGPGHRGQPDQLRPRPLPRGPRATNGWSTEYVGLPADGMDDAEPSDRPCSEPTRPRRVSPSVAKTSAIRALPTARPTSRCASPAAPSKRAWRAPSTRPATRRRGRQAPLGRRLASRLRLGRPVREHRDPAGSIYDRDLKPERPRSSRLFRRARRSRRRSRRARHLRRRLADRRRQEDRHRRSQNGYWQPYMHIGTFRELGRRAGHHDRRALCGMSADGSKVFFSTKDKSARRHRRQCRHLRGGRRPTSPAPICAALDRDGARQQRCLHPSRRMELGRGRPGLQRRRLRRGRGRAANDATFYFLSPELLDGPRTGKRQPNLYLVEPGGQPAIRRHDRLERRQAPAAAAQTPVLERGRRRPMSGPEAITVDQSRRRPLRRRDAAAEASPASTRPVRPHKFTAGAGRTTRTRSPASGPAAARSEVAVDGSGGPSAATST